MRHPGSKVLLGAAAVVFSIPSAGLAQSKDLLIGTWKLMSAVHITEKGEIKDSYGLNSIGFLTYTADGRMMAIITDGGRKPLSTSDRRGAPAEESARAFSTSLAYAGRYAFTGDKVIHHIEGATFQNWVGTDQVRLILKIDKNRMAMRVAGPLVWDEVRFAYQDLVWERLSGSGRPNREIRFKAEESAIL